MVRTAGWIPEANRPELPYVEVSRATSVDDVLAVSNMLSGLGQRPSIGLSLDQITGLGANRVTPQWGSVLANVLMGFLDDHATVTLYPPGTESANNQVARSGMFFALSRHPGVSLPTAHRGLPDVLSRWRQDWRPSDYERTLFRLPGEDEADDPEDLGTDLVAFLNPNLRPAGSSAEDVDSVVYPWLRKLLSKVRLRDADVRSKVLRDVSFATNELLKNVRDHAGIGYDGKCAISLFATGKSQADSRIYVSVVDDGVGMPSSISERSERMDSGDCESVSAAFAGDLPRRHRGRGEGLAIVREIVDRYGGTVFAATGPTADGTVIYERSNEGGSQSVKCAKVQDLSVKGTVIVLSLATARILDLHNG